MNTEEIMKLADAYAAAEQHDYLTGEASADHARAALEAALSAKQGVVDSEAKASAYMEARLWEFIDMAAAWPQAKPDSRIWAHVLVYAPAAKQEPVAQGEPRIYGAVELAQMQQRGRDMHTRPAPVNQALLERAAQLACDAVASNGGSVQMEAHVRAAIAAAEKEVRR